MKNVPAVSDGLSVALATFPAAHIHGLAPDSYQCIMFISAVFMAQLLMLLISINWRR
jgi:hypothetical protein